jgi:REP element-mobilizing transposase RayT
MSATTPLLPGQLYHIYNRGNNRENLFRERRNYEYFMRLYARHVGPVVETHAFCLLRNHFHLLIRVRPAAELARLGDEAVISRRVSQVFSNFFNAYAHAVNKAYERTGALFQRPFQRSPVTSDGHYRQLVVYIHRNPQTHGLMADFRQWPYSSYHALVSSGMTFLERQAVLSAFGGGQDWEAAHAEEEDLSGVRQDDR